MTLLSPVYLGLVVNYSTGFFFQLNTSPVFERGIFAAFI